jgi:hypothetical protein
LLHKLKAFGISGNLLQWLTNFLHNRYQSVKVGTHCSSFSPVTSGILQGSVLGPLLFLIYINDIVDIIGPNLTAKLFADDVKIYVIISDIDSINQLQDSLFAICRWAAEWQLNISINKCAVLHLGRNNLTYDYSLDGVTLPNVREMRDLGVLVNSNLSFSSHYAQITAKAHQRAGLILRCFKSRDPFVLFRAFTVYVRPLLEYCSPVWSPVYKTDVTKIESVQRRFTKRLRGLACLPYKDRLQFLSAETLELRRLKQDLLTMFKIINGIIDIDVSQFFELNNYSQTRGHDLKLVKTINNNNARAFSFACRRTDCWNALPADTILATSITVFRNLLDTHNFNKFLYI